MVWWGRVRCGLVRYGKVWLSEGIIFYPEVVSIGSIPVSGYFVKSGMVGSGRVG